MMYMAVGCCIGVSGVVWGVGGCMWVWGVA